MWHASDKVYDDTKQKESAETSAFLKDANAKETQVASDHIQTAY